jgi:hypothetical protein
LTSKGSITGQLLRALAKRDLLAVRRLAGELPSVPLPIAPKSRCCCWNGSPSYAPAARRLLARLASERALALRQLRDVVALLAELEADPAPSVAGQNLISLLRTA